MRQCGRLQLDGTPAAALQDFAAIAPRLAVGILFVSCCLRFWSPLVENLDCPCLGFRACAVDQQHRPGRPLATSMLVKATPMKIRETYVFSTAGVMVTSPVVTPYYQPNGTACGVCVY